MDAAGLSISLAGIVLKLVVFSLDFVGDAKQVYKHGATDRNVDLFTVMKSVEDATTNLVKQLDSFGDSQVLDADDEVSYFTARYILFYNRFTCQHPLVMSGLVVKLRTNLAIAA